MSLATTTHAIILAAGFGSRLAAEEGHKLLVPIAGRTLLERHIENFQRVGVTHVTIVTGYRHEVLEAAVIALTGDVDGVAIDFAYNPDFDRSNGISVLAGTTRQEERAPFYLTMADHLFEPSLFAAIAAGELKTQRDETIQGALFVDAKIQTIYDIPDATKVRFTDAGRLDAIGKEIGDFDKADVGLFWCGEGFIKALEDELAARKDCSTSDAVRRLEAVEAFAFPDIGEALWQDVDTPGARAHAETIASRW